jgi:hypothetical protein
MGQLRTANKRHKRAILATLTRDRATEHQDPAIIKLNKKVAQS